MVGMVIALALAGVAGATVGGVPALVACISLGLGMASTLEWAASEIEALERPLATGNEHDQHKE